VNCWKRENRIRPRDPSFSDIATAIYNEDGKFAHGQIGMDGKFIADNLIGAGIRAAVRKALMRRP
jgi:hypothetical protein